MIKKLYLKKGNMYVLKTPRKFEDYTILAMGVDKGWSQLIRVKKWDKQKSFQNNYSYDLTIDNIAVDEHFNHYISTKNGEKMLNHFKSNFL